MMSLDRARFKAGALDVEDLCRAKGKMAWYLRSRLLWPIHLPSRPRQ